MVTPFIAEVACPDLGAHVPAVKRGGTVGNAADLQAHIGDDGKGIPLQTEISEPGIVGMAERNFKNGITRQFKKPGSLVWHLDDKGKDVEKGTCTTLPPQMAHDCGEFFI